MLNMRFYIDYTHLKGDTARTWVEITDFVAPGFSINNRAMSDTFEYAKNLLDLTLRYDHDLFTILKNCTHVIFIKAERDGVIKFSGFFSAANSGSDNGIDYAQSLSISAEDFTDFLDIEVDSEEDTLLGTEDTYVALKNYKILDSTDTDHSVVHTLFHLAGLPFSLINPSASIPITVAAVTSKSGDTALTILNTLFYEYGYVVNWNEAGLFSPLVWILSGSCVPVFSFDYSNSLEGIKYSETTDDYGGVVVYWNEAGFRKNARLYTESLPYDSDGSFSGYAVVSGKYYPDDASVIDFTTGQLQKVYQSYEDSGTAYAASIYSSSILTDKGNLQWSTSFAISHSDFSEILITENHVVTDKFDTGITRDVVEFYNKRARIRYFNGTQNSGLLLYYMHINADVTYRKATRKAIIRRTTAISTLKEYTTRFSFDIEHVQRLTGMLALTQEKMGRTTINVASLEEVAEGSFVHFSFPNLKSGYGVILERGWSDSDEKYTYVIKGLVDE